jgi:histidinol-phosphate/aromatic aminotransferase/cobyric acid decarboxylase-like protein
MEKTARYVSSLYGGFWNFGVKDFCYLVNPYFPPNEFIESLRLRLDELIRSYPSTNWYISSLLSKALGLTHDHIVIGNGASELINAITSQYVDNLAVAIPTFDEYINRAINQGKKVSVYELDQDFTFNVEGFIQHVKNSNANTALIINPNNPTGTLVSQDSIWHILESLRLLDLVIIDESFIDFATASPIPSALKGVNSYPNLVVLKSLSKSYGIPGLRLGYAVSANKPLIENLRTNIPIWSINALAQFFLEEIGNYQQQFLDSCSSVRIATQVLYNELKSVPYLYPYPSEGNFVLCKILYGFTAAQLTSDLFEKHNMLINDSSGKRGLDARFVRLASRTKEENLELTEALRSLTEFAHGSQANDEEKG